MVMRYLYWPCIITDRTPSSNSFLLVTSDPLAKLPRMIALSMRTAGDLSLRMILSNLKVPNRKSGKEVYNVRLEIQTRLAQDDLLEKQWLKRNSTFVSNWIFMLKYSSFFSSTSHQLIASESVFQNKGKDVVMLNLHRG